MKRVADDIRCHFTNGEIEGETPLVIDGSALSLSQPVGQRRQGRDRRRKFSMLWPLHLLPQLCKRAMFIRIDTEDAIHSGQG